MTKHVIDVFNYDGDDPEKGSRAFLARAGRQGYPEPDDISVWAGVVGQTPRGTDARSCVDAL
eukprot:9461916-Pyramimonas_sp.AAC.1